MTTSKSKVKLSVALSVFVLSVLLGFIVKAEAKTFKCIYAHDPRFNEVAMADIVVNPDAVYGFSPNPDSDRLGVFADYDWSDEEVVKKAQLERIVYHTEMQSMYELWNDMEKQGKGIEEIARAVSDERNRIRIASYDGDPVRLSKLKESNLKKYGNENGPTADSLFEKYGSWETVLLKSFSENTGMDACLGLYDIYYPNYERTGHIKDNGGSTTYTVVYGDSLYKIAEKLLGDGNGSLKIAADNGIKAPYIINAGQKLVISYK